MPKGIRSYKQITLQQLHSLCETARQGSFVAAATALRISQPTVWKQVHALERQFGAKLVEPHGRGCRLTAAGRLLVEMVGAAVESIASIPERFQSALADLGDRIAVAVTPRMLLEDVSPCVAKYHAISPKTRFTFLEMPDLEVANAVLARRADFGFTPTLLTEEQRGVLVASAAYNVETRLVTPKDHPLARSRTVRPRDLVAYPFVDGPSGAGRNLIRSFQDRYSESPPTECVVQTTIVNSIRRFVKLGLGIALVPASPSTPADPELHERPMRKYFPTTTINVIRRRGGFIPPAGEEFIKLVKQELGEGLADPG